MMKLKLKHGSQLKSMSAIKAKERFMQVKLNFIGCLIEPGPMRFTDWVRRFK